MMEAGATLPQDIQDQVPAYAQALLLRFDNTELAHRLDQIAMDGSQKLPYRILETLRAARCTRFDLGRARLDVLLHRPNRPG